MGALQRIFEAVDRRVTAWMARHGIVLLRVSLGIVFFWFGFLKFFSGLSPAQDLATRTISVLTFGRLPPDVSIPILAAWECLIGLGLMLGVFMRATLLLLWLQMLGTITPLFLFPHEVFVRIPYAPTLEGQYIVKNIVLISAGIVLGATVKGGRLVSEEPAESAGAGGPQTRRRGAGVRTRSRRSAAPL
ncbi:MAG: DoxX family membrane protein [Armatimonadota bacterium]|nr:DoxX family membrane protein [Armatimonadota bacterium]